MGIKPQKRVLAIDLDGTYCTHSCEDEVGQPIDGMIDLCRALKAMDWIVVIWTVRQDSPELRKQLLVRELVYDYINENPFGPPNGSDKIYADVYLDDRGMRFEGDTRGLLERILNFTPWHKQEPPWNE